MTAKSSFIMKNTSNTMTAGSIKPPLLKQIICMTLKNAAVFSPLQHMKTHSILQPDIFLKPETERM